LHYGATRLRYTYIVRLVVAELSMFADDFFTARSRFLTFPSPLLSYKIRGCHSIFGDAICLLICDTVQIGKSLPTFRSIVLSCTRTPLNTDALSETYVSWCDCIVYRSHPELPTPCRFGSYASGYIRRVFSWEERSTLPA
jgi:hypothetical protein